MKQESQKNTIFLKMLLANDCSKNKIIIINTISVIVASLVLWVSCKIYKYSSFIAKSNPSFFWNFTPINF